MTMFAYHLSGMGYEYMEHASPWDDEDLCVQKVYNQVCYTYFPKASVGCIAGDNETYVRPCKSSCQNYINYCGVECCDESVQCVFEDARGLGQEAVGLVIVWICLRRVCGWSFRPCLLQGGFARFWPAAFDGFLVKISNSLLVGMSWTCHVLDMSRQENSRQHLKE